MSSTSDRKTNRLHAETSPYLLQHAYNPVDWYPWGPEALTAARSANKPILLSIGYSACHWCHVMAHESFEDPETAALAVYHLVDGLTQVEIAGLVGRSRPPAADGIPYRKG